MLHLRHLYEKYTLCFMNCNFEHEKGYVCDLTALRVASAADSEVGEASTSCTSLLTHPTTLCISKGQLC